MSQLSELASLVTQLTVLVRENREEIAALRARVKVLEDEKKELRFVAEPVTITLTPNQRCF